MRKANIDTEDWTGEDVLRLLAEERKKNYLGCLFKDPVLFFKALVPDRIKARIKQKIGHKTSESIYIGYE